MTDGTTATQVSPIISESEVTMFRDFMNRLANTVVQASDFAKQVDILREELNTIREDASAVRKRNSELDEELAYVREQRNKAQDEARQANHEAGQWKSSYEMAEKNFSNASAELDHQRNVIAELKTERDEAQFRVLELTERAEKAESVLNDLRSRLGLPVPVAELPPLMPAPTPEPTPSPLAEPAPAPTSGPSAGPGGSSEPEQERVYAKYGDPNFNKTDTYDPDKNAWYYIPGKRNPNF